MQLLKLYVIFQDVFSLYFKVLVKASKIGKISNVFNLINKIKTNVP